MESCRFGWDMYKDPDETGNTETLNSNESSLPLEKVSPPPVELTSLLPERCGLLKPSRSDFPTKEAASSTVVLTFLIPAMGINPKLPEEMVISFPEATVMADNTGSP